LDDFDEIKIAVDYKMNGEKLQSFPGESSLSFVFSRLKPKQAS